MIANELRLPLVPVGKASEGKILEAALAAGVAGPRAAAGRSA
jgi:hypothetical protein